MFDRSPYRRLMRASPVIESWFPPDQSEPMELWRPDVMARYQTEAIADILRYAYENNEFYRASFHDAGVTPADFKALDDLARYPFLHKDRLRGNPWLLLSVPRQELSQIHVSTGTTSTSVGDHIYSLFSWQDIYLDELAINMPLMSYCRPEDLVVIGLPYEMSSAGIAFHRFFQHGGGATVVNAGKGGFYSDPHKTLLMMADLACDVLVTTPSWAMQLLETAIQQGLATGNGSGIHPRIVWLTGEGCSDAFRKRLEAAWGCPCLMYYGSLECGPLGNECLMREGYHLPEGHIYVEIIDPDTGEVLPEGRVGEICVTVLYRRAMPLIRYRVQDSGYLDSEPCACCIERPRLFLRGRVQDQIRLGDREFSPLWLEEHLFRIPEVGNNYQFYVHDEALSVVAEVNPAFGKSPEIEETIRCALECIAGEVRSVKLVDKIPSSGGKITRVIRRSPP